MRSCWCRQRFFVSRFSGVDNVRYPVTPRGHFTGDEAAMATKPDDFGAHDGGWRLADQRFQSRNPLRKKRRRHEGLVTACAKAAKGLTFPVVGDSACRQLAGQHLLVDLWISPRTREVPDVDQLRDPVFLEEGNELIQ